MRAQRARAKALPPATPRSEEDARPSADRLRLSAEELLDRYCASVYEGTGSYVETGRRLGLDRRTVKERVERASKG